MPPVGPTATASPLPTATGLHEVPAKAILSHTCDAGEFHFIITQIANEALAPASIHVIWDNGAEEDVPMSRYTGGSAHYLTTSNLDAYVVSATATLAGWSGQFNLSHGPCPPKDWNPNATAVPGALTPGAETATPAPTATATPAAVGQIQGSLVACRAELINGYRLSCPRSRPTSST